MRRRDALKTLGASAASLTLLTAVPSVGATTDNTDGPQPLGGDLPNENVNEEQVTAFPERDETIPRHVGNFLTLQDGWGDIGDGVLLESSRQTFEYDGQTFVLDSLDDWERKTDKWVTFTHTDPPKRKGKTFDVTWDVIMTDTVYDPGTDTTYEAGDRFRPNAFPLSNTYTIVK